MEKTHKLLRDERKRLNVKTIRELLFLYVNATKIQKILSIKRLFLQIFRLFSPKCALFFRLFCYFFPPNVRIPGAWVHIG